MAIELPPLPYALDALEPHLSRRTLEFHYGKHHKGYVDKLNKLIGGTELEHSSLEEIMDASFERDPKIYNNAAQAWNHAFYWKGLSPQAGIPSPALEAQLKKHFGSLDEFKQKFNQEAKNLFGSGWAWLVRDSEDSLQIRATPNAENPLQQGETPLLTCDVWEHAYYLDYQNERMKYLERYWNCVNWRFVEQNLSRSPGQPRSVPPGKPQSESQQRQT